MPLIIQKPTVGRIVHYRGLDGVVYPAVVLSRVTAQVTPGERASWLIDIEVFGRAVPTRPWILENVPYSPGEKKPGTWRYPPHSTETITVPE